MPCFLLISLMGVLMAASGLASSGPGISPWPDGGPPLLYEINGLGLGYSSPAVSSSGIFVTGSKDSTGYLYSYDPEGKFRWKAVYGSEWVYPYPGSRAAPVVSDSLVYTTSGKGDIACFYTETGKILWTVNIFNGFEGQNPSFGYSLPAVLHGDLLICLPGNEQDNVVALDRFSGRMVWSSPGRNEVAGYASPVLVNHGGSMLLVAFSEMNLLILDAADGRLIWSYELSFKGNQPCNKPLFDDGQLFCVAGSGNGAICVVPDSAGNLAHVKWKNLDFDTYFGDFVKIGDFLYGSSDARHKYLSLDARSGAVRDSLPFGIGSVIVAEDKLVAYNQQGLVGLISVHSGEMELLSSFRVSKGSNEHFSHPVYFNGRLYIRRGDSLMAFIIR